MDRTEPVSLHWSAKAAGLFAFGGLSYLFAANQALRTPRVQLITLLATGGILAVGASKKERALSSFSLFVLGAMIAGEAMERIFSSGHGAIRALKLRDIHTLRWSLFEVTCVGTVGGLFAKGCLWTAEGLWIGDEIAHCRQRAVRDAFRHVLTLGKGTEQTFFSGLIDRVKRIERLSHDSDLGWVLTQDHLSIIASDDPETVYCSLEQRMPHWTDEEIRLFVERSPEEQMRMERVLKIAQKQGRLKGLVQPWIEAIASCDLRGLSQQQLEQDVATFLQWKDRPDRGETPEAVKRLMKARQAINGHQGVLKIRKLACRFSSPTVLPLIRSVSSYPLEQKIRQMNDACEAWLAIEKRGEMSRLEIAPAEQKASADGEQVLQILYSEFQGRIDQLRQFFQDHLRLNVPPSEGQICEALVFWKLATLEQAQPLFSSMSDSRDERTKEILKRLEGYVTTIAVTPEEPAQIPRSRKVESGTKADHAVKMRSSRSVADQVHAYGTQALFLGLRVLFLAQICKQSPRSFVAGACLGALVGRPVHRVMSVSAEALREVDRQDRETTHSQAADRIELWRPIDLHANAFTSEKSVLGWTESLGLELITQWVTLRFGWPPIIFLNASFAGLYAGGLIERFQLTPERNLELAKVAAGRASRWKAARKPNPAERGMSILEAASAYLTYSHM